MEFFFLACLIGFATTAAIVPEVEVTPAPALPGIYGISDDEQICIENYLNGEVLDLECDGSIKNVMERLKARFKDPYLSFGCAQKIIDDYKYKNVYLQYEYNAKTHRKTRELSKLAQAAEAGLKIFCADIIDKISLFGSFRYDAKEISLEKAQCAYLYSIEKGIIKEFEYPVDSKGFDKVDCKSYYEEWRSKHWKTYDVDICDEAHRSEFEKCVHNRPSLIYHNLEMLTFEAVVRLTDDDYNLYFRLNHDFVIKQFINERSGLECVRELADKVIARSRSV